VWALSRLLPQRLATLAQAHRAAERDASVADEWAAALAEIGVG
jgi:hypothetical protein